MRQLTLLILSLTALQGHEAIKIQAVPYDLGGTPPNLTGPLATNFELTTAERFQVNQVIGPESFAYHKGHMYTGLLDGRIVDISDCGVRTIARLAPPNCGGGPKCARPLGLRIDKLGRLLVADSAMGLFRINLGTGRIETLYSSATPVNGQKTKFINDLVIARDGTILFTDSSATWNRKEFLYIILEGQSTGRLLAYSDSIGRTIEVMGNLSFPNGIELSPDESFLLIAESSRARIRKLDLKPGPNLLNLSNFADNLPGMPDNIRASGRGTYWVAMSQARHENMTSSLVDQYADKPRMREMVVMMSSMEQILEMTEKYGMIVELDQNGNIIRSLQDPTGQRVHTVSEVMERDGYLYLGHYKLPYVSRVPVSKVFNVERFIVKLKTTCRARTLNLENLRRALKRIVAIAHFRRALLNAKRRRDEAERQRLLSTTTATPASSTVADTTSSTTTSTVTGTTMSSTSSMLTSSTAPTTSTSTEPSEMPVTTPSLQSTTSNEEEIPVPVGTTTTAQSTSSTTASAGDSTTGTTGVSSSTTASAESTTSSPTSSNTAASTTTASSQESSTSQQTSTVP